jgi:outer membrane lipoprotein-sorting protein
MAARHGGTGPDKDGRAMTAIFRVAAAAAFILAGASFAVAAESTRKPSDKEMIAALSGHFAAVPTMKGEFLQFNPSGEQVGGTFAMARPGRIRFNYQGGAGVEVIANGKTVAIHNKKLKTWDFYPLDKTPLKMLLAERIAADDKAIRGIVAEADLTTVTLADDAVFGDAVLTLMFDPQTFDLRQWVVRDAKGAETSVMIFNVEPNIALPDSLFQFDELAIRRQQQEKSN